MKEVKTGIIFLTLFTLVFRKIYFSTELHSVLFFTFVAFDLLLPSVGPIVGYALIVVAEYFRCLFLKLQLLDDFALDTLAHDADDGDGDVGDDRARHGDRYGGLDDGDHGDDGLASKHWRLRMWM